MKVAVAQMSAGQDVESNVAAVNAVLEGASSEGVDLVVLPECIVSGYIYGSRDEAREHAVSLSGPQLASIARTCERLQLHAVLGLLEDAGDGSVYNAAVLIDDSGEIVGHYRKTHLPTLGVDRFVDAGTAKPPVVDTRLGRIGLAICYDLRFPESARSLALDGAEIIAQPSLWPPEAAMLAEHFSVVRAAENRVFIAIANRSDTEAGATFMGRSQIVDPGGRRVADAGPDAEGLVSAEVDLARARDKRIVTVPGEYEVSLFDDRRPELYQRITEN